MRITQTVLIQSVRNRFMRLSIFYPRVWKIMAAGAIPFLLTVTRYFEALERTGVTGMFIEPHKTPDSCLVMERQPEGLTRIYRV